jgi:hypothetical protein
LRPGKQCQETRQSISGRNDHRLGRSFAYFSADYLSKNLKELARHAAGGEMPDVIDHADLIAYRGQYAVDVHRRLFRSGLAHGVPRWLPLPNGPFKLRSLSLLEPRDELVLRAVAGVVLERTISIVDRERVFSYEASTKSGTWRLQGTNQKGIDWNGLKRKGLRLMRASEPAAVLQRDVKSYYASCASRSICRWLEDEIALPEPLVRCCSERLQAWEAQGYSGLPIGPEFSAVVGTAYLFGVDAVLAGHPDVLHHLRVTDDFYIALYDLARASDVDETLREALAARGLTLNETKSEVLTHEEAIDRFEQREREYWRARLAAGPDDPACTIVAMLDELAEDPARDMGLSGYVLGAARRQEAKAAIPVVLGSLGFLELWPTICGGLLLSQPATTAGLVDDIMSRLEEPYSDRTAARNLHLIRALPRVGLGRAEGEILRSIAVKEHQPIPVRAWALYRACSTPVLSRSDRADLALDVSIDTFLQRSSILSFRADDSAERSKLLSDNRITSGPLRYSGQWAMAA